MEPEKKKSCGIKKLHFGEEGTMVDLEYDYYFKGRDMDIYS